ncbi:MAG: ABC transporter ATP-binding protein, partial [Clostridia bacterium]|nr:ABC transporter ATP-binding protein [Clostridia bacterium]
PWMKVKSIMKYYKDMYPDFNFEKSKELIKKLEINMENKVSELSTGLKGRLKVALAISRNALIYLFDEPLNGLDPISREMVLNTITEIINENKVIIISSHLVSELETCLDEVIFLKNGMIELQGDAEKIRSEKGKSIEGLYKEVY